MAKTTRRDAAAAERHSDRHEALAWVTTAWRSEQILRALESEPESA